MFAGAFVTARRKCRYGPGSDFLEFWKADVATQAEGDGFAVTRGHLA